VTSSPDVAEEASRTLRLRPFGSVLTVRTMADPVIAAVQQGLSRYPEGLAVGGELHVTVDVHPGEEGDPGWPDVSTDADADRLVIRCGSSRATVWFADGLAEVSLAEDLLPIADAVRLFVESAFTSVHVHHSRLVAVHSALVSRDGVGVMLRGPSGAGKSTLTYACLRRGMSITSDDWLYASARRPAGTFAGYPWRMLMTEEAAARFGELTGVATVPHPSEERAKIAIHPPDRQQVTLQDVDAVVILDRADRLSLRRLDPAEAAERFWADALPTERDHISDDWVAGLMARPAYMLSRGTSPADAARVLDDLAVSLR
jgi:hypothetical protein